MIQEEFNWYELEDHDRDFIEYHRDNPHIYEMFKKFTFELINCGYQNIGANLIKERIRWETYTDKRFEPLKINNNYSPGYARLFMQEYPEHDVFRCRELKSHRNKHIGEKNEHN